MGTRTAGAMIAAVCLSLLTTAPAVSAAPRTLFAFDDGFDTGVVQDRGGAVRLVERGGGQALRIDFAAGQDWPGVFLPAPEGKWDFSEFAQIDAEVTNVGGEPVRLMLRADNPGADGNRNCNTEAVTLGPGQTRTLTVTFGKSHGGVGFPLDKTNVIGLLFFVDHPQAAQAVVVDDIRAAGGVVPVPDWVGTRPPVPGNWTMTLDENFDGDKLNMDLWNTRLVWDGPLERDMQVYLPENVTVGDGLMRIKFEKRTAHQYGEPNLPTRDYATGCATTLGKFTQRYGYFEARLKFPRARGGWPTFWMMPDRGPGAGNIWERRSTHNGGMEIDIAEHLCEWGPGRYNVAAHWDGYEDEHRSVGSSQVTYPPTPDEFHVAGLLWEPGKLTWYCDGVEKWSWENERVASVPLYLKFTIQVGGAWAAHDVDDGALPDAFLVDYVRVWQRDDLAATK
jgi:beta-glucanase (GH16 family)